MQPLLRAARDFLRRHWQGLLRLRHRLRLSEEAFHLVMAGAVGIVGGLTNLVFYLATESVKHLALRHRGDLVEIAEVMSWWQRLLAPTLGGLAAGAVLAWGMRVVRQGSTNFLEVVVVGDGRLPFRSGAIKAFSSLLSFGTGASIGREGTLIHLSATLASKLGQLARWPPYRLRLLVACGAAAGMAAAYNAPIAGAVFAAQLVLGSFSMTLFAPLLVASVVATMVSRSFFGIAPWYQAPAFDFTRLGQLPWFVLLGILSGVLGAAFLRLLRLFDTAFARVHVPLYVKLGFSGLVVGAIAQVYPEVWGNGYGATNRILQEHLELTFLAGLFLAKLLATVTTVGSGAVGGVLTPTLFLGASLGSALATLLHDAGAGITLPTGAFALVGMGSVLAATTHSPLLAIIILFEISLNYSIMPPLMLACAVATLVARRLHPDSVYTEPLRRLRLGAERETERLGAATDRTVGDLMHPPVPPVLETAGFRDLADRFLATPNNFLPVVDARQRLVGLVALQDLKEHLATDFELRGVIAYDVMRPPSGFLTPDQRLLEALPMLLASDLRNVPVVNTRQEMRLVGAIARIEALGILGEAIAARSLPAR